MQDITNNADVIDVRDVIESYESALDAIESGHYGDVDTSDAEVLGKLLADLRGNGGDEQWLGYWYPVTLIRDSYFIEYARDLADDLVIDGQDMSWPFTCIDWERAARELQMDYGSVDYDGVTYWYR